MKNILVACEESQAITKEFRKLGFNAFSCDILECSGGCPEWHIMGDCLPLINGGNYTFSTMDGKEHFVNRWDLIIAHPPCTYLAIAGNGYFNEERYGEKAKQRKIEREKAIEFFMRFTKADADCIAIENPVSVISTRYRKPDQIIQPYYWGDCDVKTTCLWLFNLPKLIPETTEKPEIQYKEWISKDGKKKRQSLYSYQASSLPKEERQRMRSKTYPGIAKAIATQWGEYLNNQPNNQ